MSEFAIGSLAVMAELNPQIYGPGTLPIIGYQLSVSWGLLVPLVASIAGAHFLLVVLMLWIAKPVVVPDDSSLCTAHLLYDLVGRMKGKGNLLDAKELAHAISSQGNNRVMYGVRDVVEKAQGKDIELGGNVMIRGEGKRFPGGLYV